MGEWKLQTEKIKLWATMAIKNSCFCAKSKVFVHLKNQSCGGQVCARFSATSYSPSRCVLPKKNE